MRRGSSFCATVNRIRIVRNQKTEICVLERHPARRSGLRVHGIGA